MSKIKDFVSNAQRWSSITVLYKRRLRVNDKLLKPIVNNKFVPVLWSKNQKYSLNITFTTHYHRKIKCFFFSQIHCNSSFKSFSLLVVWKKRKVKTILTKPFSSKVTKAHCARFSAGALHCGKWAHDCFYWTAHTALHARAFLRQNAAKHFRISVCSMHRAPKDVCFNEKKCENNPKIVFCFWSELCCCCFEDIFPWKLTLFWVKKSTVFWSVWYMIKKWSKNW